jgi:hypothetical protein
MRRLLECPNCEDPVEEADLCPHCGECELCCDCDELYDADELGLDPEEDDRRRYHEEG